MVDVDEAFRKYKFWTNVMEMRSGESPIESLFVYQLVKYLAPETELSEQVTVATALGNFRPDFVLRLGNRSVALECDGRDFHRTAEAMGRDNERDIAILGEGHFECIYRFTGTAIVNQIDECLFGLSVAEPKMFSERGRTNLATLAHVHDVDGFDLDEWLRVTCAGSQRRRRSDNRWGGRREAEGEGG